MADAPPATESIRAIGVSTLGDYLDGDYGEIRQGVREQLARPEFAAVDPEITSSEYRRRVLDWSKILADEGQTNLGLPVAYGGGGNIGGSIAAFETLAFGDLSLLVKTGVQYGLWGGAILHLGTERHHDEYLADIAALKLPGCFAMSESGHGSDVQAVGTTATYDLQTEEWVIDTPAEADRKDWIGNAAAHGRAAAVFAQLIVAGTNHGVHAFVVPSRTVVTNSV